MISNSEQCVEACQDCCIGIHSIVASALLESAECG
jgi:hypothetical protein